MMIIETWIAAVLVVGISLIGFMSSVCLLAEQQRHDKTREELKRVMEEKTDLEKYIAGLKAKHIIEMSNKFYEGKKK